MNHTKIGMGPFCDPISQSYIFETFDMERPRPLALPISRNENDPTAIEERDIVITAINKHIYYAIAWIFILVIIGCFLFIIPSIKPPKDSIETWIERFGALVGLLSLAIEYQLKKSLDRLNRASLRLPPVLFQSLNDSYKFIHVFEKISVISAILGALIWAYGSVVIYWLHIVNI